MRPKSFAFFGVMAVLLGGAAGFLYDGVQTRPGEGTTAGPNGPIYGRGNPPVTPGGVTVEPVYTTPSHPGAGGTVATPIFVCDPPMHPTYHLPLAAPFYTFDVTMPDGSTVEVDEGDIVTVIIGGVSYPGYHIESPGVDITIVFPAPGVPSPCNPAPGTTIEVVDSPTPTWPGVETGSTWPAPTRPGTVYWEEHTIFQIKPQAPPSGQ